MYGNNTLKQNAVSFAYYTHIYIQEIRREISLTGGAETPSDDAVLS